MSGGAWMFVWMMLALKVPIAALLTLVWWASRSPAESEPEQRDWRPLHKHPDDRPRPRRPRPPRRGPHAATPPPSPKRTRVHAKARVLSH